MKIRNVQSLIVIVGVVVLSFGNNSGANAQNLDNIGTTDPVQVGGSVSAYGTLYNANDIADRRESFSWTLSGALNVNLYDLALPFTFTLSEQDRSFSQPFNQFGVSPRYKWITGHFGYRNLTFSPFTLAGHQFLGAGVELNPGLLRLGFMYGRFNRAVELDTNSDRLEAPAYERTGWSGKIGVGSGSSYIDLIVLKAEDDTNSLQTDPIIEGVRPGENLVVGLSGRTTVLEVATLYADVAVSDYTRDVRSDMLDVGGTAANALADVIEPRTSTQVYTAIKSGVTLAFNSFGLDANYERVDPDYQSMGAYYLANDLEGFTLAPHVSLLQQKLRINSSFRMHKDNIQDKKAATTTRFSPTIGISYAPSVSFGVDVQLNDVVTTQESGRLPLSDSTRMDMRNPMISVSPRYMIQDSATSHSFFLTAMHQQLIDNNELTSRFSEYNTTMLSFVYSISLLQTGLSLSASVNTNRLENFGGEFYNSGFSLGATKGLLENTLSVGGSASVSFQQNANTVSATLNSSYTLEPHHSFDLQLALSTTSVSDNTNQSFSEFTAVAGYVFTF